MDIETLGIIGAIGLFGAGLAYKYWKKMKPLVEDALADGQLTLDEAIELANEAKEIVDEIKSLPSYSAMRRMRKSEIKNLCAKYDVDAEGTKEKLIEALLEKKGELDG
jgi:polyhydroxyalkanoate synthesis regulator phasin